VFLFLFNQCTWPAPEGAEEGEGGSAATVSVQSTSTCKRNGAQLAQCVFCSAVTCCHSTSTKLLFIYLKTCIPWEKKMPQDSSVFLKLNPAGWSGAQASTSVLPPAAGAGLPMSQAPPPSPSCRRAWQNASRVLSHRPAALQEATLGPSTSPKSRSATASYGRGRGFHSSDCTSFLAALGKPSPRGRRVDIPQASHTGLSVPRRSPLT